MNYMKEIAELLEVELGEEFNIILSDGVKSPNSPYKITKKGLINKHGSNSLGRLENLLIGSYKIKKLPYKPRKGKEYWYPNLSFDKVSRHIWHNLERDRKIQKNLGVYKTEKEAEERLKEIKEWLDISINVDSKE